MRSIAVGDRLRLAARSSADLAAVVEHTRAHTSEPCLSTLGHALRRARCQAPGASPSPLDLQLVFHSINDNRLFFDCRSLNLWCSHDRVASLITWCFSPPISCCSMHVSCWLESRHKKHLASKEDLQITRSLHDIFVTRIFKLFQERWADRQRACLLELVVVHLHRGHVTTATFARFDNDVSFGVTRM